MYVRPMMNLRTTKLGKFGQNPVAIPDTRRMRWVIRQILYLPKWSDALPRPKLPTIAPVKNMV